MAKIFKGRPLLPGKLEGKALVSRQPFNTTASYFENMFAGNTETAPCTDANNEELFKKQSKCLMLGNLIFGAVSIAIICFGFFVINRQNVPGNKQHIVCYEGDEWI